MIERIRAFLETSAGRVTGIALCVVALVIVVWSFRSNLGDTEAEAASKDRIFVCSETGKAFHVTIEPNMTIPVDSPYSGKKTGYPAALCYWTKDGQLKKDPTPVLLNETVGKRGPTFCPDCGRLVGPQAPPPMPGVKPPPTEAEYKAWAQRQQQQ
jgi:hypothetical protein